jgi:glycosyltransferase involved in cell wall biosynthesis
MIQPSPTISVIIPCRNESAHIENCICSILAQEPPPGGFEVIVADGMSDDGTRKILEKLARENPALRIIDNVRRITPSGMNAAIREAKGNYIAVMGAHNRYAPDYLCRSVEVLQETGADNVGGVTICEARSHMQEAIAAAHHSRFGVGGARWHKTDYEGVVDTVFGGVYRRQIFDWIGLFDEELVRNQDDELNLRLTRAGGKIWQSPRVKSWYHPRDSLKDLWRQYLQYGYWKVRVIQKNHLPASLRHLIPAAFILILVLFGVGSIWSTLLAWAFGTTLGTYLSCNFAASLRAASRTRWKNALRLPLVFACYHFAYGFGFIHGILDFVIFGRVPRNRHTQLSRTVVRP